MATSTRTELTEKYDSLLKDLAGTLRCKPNVDEVSERVSQAFNTSLFFHLVLNVDADSLIDYNNKGRSTLKCQKGPYESTYIKPSDVLPLICEEVADKWSPGMYRYAFLSLLPGQKTAQEVTTVK